MLRSRLSFARYAYLIGIGKSQVKASTIVILSTHTEFASNAKARHGNRNASLVFFIAILIIEIGNVSRRATLLPFVNRILPLLVRFGLPPPKIVLFLGSFPTSFFQLDAKTTESDSQ